VSMSVSVSLPMPMSVSMSISISMSMSIFMQHRHGHGNGQGRGKGTRTRTWTWTLTYLKEKFSLSDIALLWYWNLPISEYCIVEYRYCDCSDIGIKRPLVSQNFRRYRINMHNLDVPYRQHNVHYESPPMLGCS
jgi:hypothetical protein